MNSLAGNRRIKILPKIEAQKIIISSAHEGQRLDNFLLTKLKGVPKTRIYRLIRKGEVRVNSGRTKPLYRLKLGDTVRVPPVRMGVRETVKPSLELQSLLAASILYEDEELLVINKPSGLPVHGGTQVQCTVIDVLKAMMPDQPFLALAHRLDKETSGCLIVAKNRASLTELHDLLKAHKVQKTYCALTLGRWKNKITHVTLAMQKNQLRSGERVACISEEGKSARTDFIVTKEFGNASLMDVILHTGRTHQIRLHAQISGHPVAGDEKYGDKQFNQQMKQLGLRRLFLHAKKIEFVRKNGQHVSVLAPLDNRLNDVLKKLQ